MAESRPMSPVGFRALFSSETLSLDKQLDVFKIFLRILSSEAGERSSEFCYGSRSPFK